MDTVVGKSCRANLMIRCCALLAAVITSALAGSGQAQAQGDGEPALGEAARDGYVVNVELPLVGDRDERVRQQILRIADAANNAAQRPIVVLRFQSTPLADIGEPDNGGLGTRGSQFERCLALARFMTSAEASRVWLVAYLPKSVEGHAVLPVLACEEILAAPDAELGRASIDEPADATVLGAYRDVVSRRATLPEPVVMTMLEPKAEAYDVTLADGTGDILSREQIEKERAAGKVLKEETIWPGGRLAAYNGQQLRSKGWIARTVDDPSEIPAALGLTTSLRTVGQLPRQWNPVALTISGSLPKSRVNQIIRSLENAVQDDDVNLIVLFVEQANCSFTDASRLASTLASLGDNVEDVYTLSIVSDSLAGPSALIAVACDETVLLSGVNLGPDLSAAETVVSEPVAQRVLGELAQETGRPLPLLAALVDPEVVVKEYTHQGTGRRAIFTDWLMAKQPDSNMWVVKAKVAGGEPIDSEIALRYRLIDSIDESASLALSRLGLDKSPKELATPWLDASIQMVLSQPWVPRLLLTIGFFALMAELGNPGLGAGGFLAALCFLGFFWIEGLNGNVEWLEILLFIAGLVALAIEIFVVPGFGVFGIGGLLMVFVSVVLASQTFVWPTTSAQLSEVAVNLFWVACLALGGMIGLLFMHKQLERLPMFRWLSLQPGGSDDLDEIDIREASVHWGHLLGQDGLTTTRLNPSGKAQFGRDVVAVVGTGKMIDEGTPVRVVEVRGNLVLVEEL